MTYHIPTERINALSLAAAEGRVARGAWSDTDADGRALACTLGWLGDGIGDPCACPSSFMPRWLAHLIPECNDETSEEGFTVWLSRIPGVLRRIATVPDDVWSVLERRAKARAVVEAMRNTDDAAALTACRDVLRLLRDGGTEDEFAAAKAAAEARTMTADGIAWAHWTAAWAARAIAKATAKATARAVVGSAMAAPSADSDAASAEAWDRMTAALLDDLDNATKGRDLGPFPTETSR